MSKKTHVSVKLSPVLRCSPLVEQVELALREAIRQRAFPTEVLPVLSDLSRQFGVSRETIRLALNSLEDAGIVARDGRNRTVVQSASLVTERESPSSVIGYLEEEYELDRHDGEIVGGPQSQHMLQGAISAASRIDYQVIVRRAKPFRLREAFKEMRSRVDLGGIIFSSVSDEQFLKEMCRQDIPAVLLDHELYLPRFDSIRPDSKQNAMIAVNHLLELGHTRIVCASWLQTDINPWYIQGYRQALRDARVRRSKEWEIEVRLNEAGAREALRHVLSLSPQPTAIVCFHNTLASQVIAVAASEGLSVPEDLSVVGGGGEQVAQLTCTNIDWEHLGGKAVELLHGAIATNKWHAPKHYLVPYELSIHGSTAPPRR